MNKEQISSELCCAKASDDLLGRMFGGDLSCREGNGCSATDCTGERKTWGLDGYPLAMVYAANQAFRKVYDPHKALSKGTVFSELDLPFLGERIGKGGTCR